MRVGAAMAIPENCIELLTPSRGEDRTSPPTPQTAERVRDRVQDRKPCLPPCRRHDKGSLRTQHAGLVVRHPHPPPKWRARKISDNRPPALVGQSGHADVEVRIVGEFGAVLPEGRSRALEEGAPERRVDGVKGMTE